MKKWKSYLILSIILLSISKISNSESAALPNNTANYESLKQEIDMLKKELEAIKSSKSITIGNGAKSNLENSVSIGNGSEANVENSVSIGTNAGKNSGVGLDTSGQIGNVYIGEDSGNSAKGRINVFLGYLSGKSSEVTNSIFLGNSAGEGAKKEHNIGIGFRAFKDSDGLSNVSIGQNSGNGVIGNSNVSIGISSNNFLSNKKSFNMAVAVGIQSSSEGDRSVALGGASKTRDFGAVALGFGANANNNTSIAIGYGALSNVDNGVSIGSFSVANRDKESLGYDPKGEFKSIEDVVGDKKTDYLNKKEEYLTRYNTLTDLNKEMDAFVKEKKDKKIKVSEYIKDPKYIELDTKIKEERSKINTLDLELLGMTNVWSASRAAVSIGNKEYGLTRQIIGVAAGTEDTDVVNVAQLKRLGETLEEKQKEIEKVLEEKLGNSKKSMHVGVASAIAMASLPNINNGLSASFGTYMGESAFALGLNGKKGRVRYKANGSLTTQGKVGFGLGFGISFEDDK